MKSPFSGLLALTLLLVLCSSLQAKTNTETLARNVLSENEHEAASAIAELRAQGLEGLNVLFQLYHEQIQKQIEGSGRSDNWERLHDALDEVSQQRDSYLSGLYWYTDLSQAKAAARASGKPILSLRLLGKLTDEFSCANSRFFRTILYSNQNVSKLLREQFVLHWQSVRPAPRVTIDFGDGRKLQGTITGNSIHYVLDSEGLPLDALPGLYGPQAFLRELARIQQLYTEVKGIPYPARVPALNEYHRRSIDLITTKWLVDVQKTGGQIPASFVLRVDANGTPRAIDIAPVAVTKMVTEVNLLRAMTRGAESLGKVTDEEIWNRIALQHLDDARLDDHSIQLIRRQTEKSRYANTRFQVLAEANLTSMVRKLELSVAMDTVRNEYMLRTKLHAWLVAQPSRNNLEKFNDEVYAQLFLTPKSDPWLGLFSPETYMALETGGVSN
jgi:hypothetical protein